MTISGGDRSHRYVTDTHTLIWHLMSDAKLGQTAKGILTRVDNGEAELVIPAVVLAELYMLAEKRRVEMTTIQMHEQVAQWQQAQNIVLTSLTPAIVKESRNLIQIPDIFDRLIVSEARLQAVPLITKDRILTATNLVEIIW